MPRGIHCTLCAGDGVTDVVQSLPCELNVSVAAMAASSCVFEVQFDVLRRSSRLHPVTRTRLEEDGGLVGAEVLFVGQNVTPRRRRFATAKTTTTTTKLHQQLGRMFVWVEIKMLVMPKFPLNEQYHHPFNLFNSELRQKSTSTVF